jgi:hypothetical protein
MKNKERINKTEKWASDKVARIDLMARHLSNQISFTRYDWSSVNYYINLSKKEGESARVDLMVRPLSDKQSSFTGIPGSIPGAGASILFGGSK